MATTNLSTPALYQAATDLLSQHGWDVAIGRLEMMVEVLKEERQARIDKTIRERPFEKWKMISETRH
jgi:hypothetical protein